MSDNKNQSKFKNQSKGKDSSKAPKSTNEKKIVIREGYNPPKDSTGRPPGSRPK